jgi:CheY-like chemotaxis protein
MAHVVLVEDNELLAEMYQHSLLAKGYQCSIAYDGVTGLDLIEHTVPDLVLLDLMLPQMSGDEVLQRMRNNERCKDIKVIILTNISESEAPESLQSLKFERYIVKADATLSGVLEIVGQTIGPSPQPA